MIRIKCAGRICRMYSSNPEIEWNQQQNVQSEYRVGIERSRASTSMFRFDFKIFQVYRQSSPLMLQCDHFDLEDVLSTSLGETSFTLDHVEMFCGRSVGFRLQHKVSTAAQR